MIPSEFEMFINYLLYSQIILFPLGVWKLIEIIIWIIKHVHIGIN